MGAVSVSNVGEQILTAPGAIPCRESNRRGACKGKGMSDPWDILCGDFVGEILGATVEVGAR